MSDPAGSAMLADVRRTSDILHALAARADSFAAFRTTCLTPEPGGRLHAFGCGDGLFAASAMAAQGIVADTALDFLLYRAPNLDRRDRVLAISMSGNVDRTVAAAAAAIASGAGLAILTNGDGGRLGALGAPLLSLDIPSLKPFLCGTSSYAGTLYGLALLLGATLPGSVGPLAAATQVAFDRALAALGDLDAPARGVRFLSAGQNIGSAAYGAAKIVELCRTPVWFGDIEEFAHSQFWASDPAELIVYLSGNAGLAEIANDSAAALNDMGFRTIAIETESAPVPAARTRIVVPSVPEALSPVAFATPLQVLAWRVAIATGYDPDTRAHLKNDELRFRTSRRLTRKSLIGTGH